MELISLGGGRFAVVKTADSIYLVQAAGVGAIWDLFYVRFSTGRISHTLGWEVDFRRLVSNFHLKVPGVSRWVDPFTLNGAVKQWGHASVDWMEANSDSVPVWNSPNSRDTPYVYWNQMNSYPKMKEALDPIFAHRKPFFMDMGCIRILRSPETSHLDTKKEVLATIKDHASRITMGVLLISGDDDKDPMGGKTKYKFSTCRAYAEKHWETVYLIVKALTSAGINKSPVDYSALGYGSMYQALEYAHTKGASTNSKPGVEVSEYLGALEKAVAHNQEHLRRRLSELVIDSSQERSVLLLSGPAITAMYRLMDAPSCMKNMCEAYPCLHPTETYANSPETCALAVLCVAGTEESITKFADDVGKKIINNKDDDVEIWDEEAADFISLNTFARCMTWKDRDQFYFDRMYLSRQLSDSGGSRALAAINGFAASLKAMGYKALQGNLTGSGNTQHSMSVDLRVTPRSPDQYFLFPYMDTCRWGEILDTKDPDSTVIRCHSKTSADDRSTMTELCSSRGLVTKPVKKICSCCNQPIPLKVKSAGVYTITSRLSGTIYFPSVCMPCLTNVLVRLSYQYSDDYGVESVYCLRDLAEYSDSSNSWIFKGDTLRGYVRIEGFKDQVPECDVKSAVYDMQDLRKRKLMPNSECTRIGTSTKFVANNILEEYQKHFEDKKKASKSNILEKDLDKEVVLEAPVVRDKAKEFKDLYVCYPDHTAAQYH